MSDNRVIILGAEHHQSGAAGGLMPRMARALVVCAHPDDESFGLGAVLAALAEAGTKVSVLSFTRGEASTLNADTEDLGAVRADELAAAATVLGVTETELLDYRDGHLIDVAVAELAEHVHRRIVLAGADTVFVFDEGGVTGHPDHGHATAAAMLAAEHHDLEVVAWTIPHHVAETLNAEFDTTFVGRRPEDIDVSIKVDRAIQLKAIDCHKSQSVDNPVLWRRLELLGDVEHLRYLRKRPRALNRAVAVPA
jgi:N-acetylglucosamine malate deacetylase 2